MKNIILLIAIFSFSANAGALARGDMGGSEGGGGGGTLARLLVYAQGYLLEVLPEAKLEDSFPGNPALRSIVVNNQKKIMEDIGAIEFVPVKGKKVLKDFHFDYETWIRLLPGDKVKIEYIPNLALYKKTISELKKTPQQSSKPQLRDVIGFVIHELGHKLGLSEEDSWKLAFGLQKQFDKQKKFLARDCNINFWMKKEGTRLVKDFTIDSLETVYIDHEEYHFDFRNSYSKDQEPRFSVQGYGPNLKLAIHSYANTALFYGQEMYEYQAIIECNPQGSKDK